MGKEWHGGKGDKSRACDVNKFSRNMEKIYERKNWKFWAIWEGYSLDNIKFDSTGLEEGEQISYKEFNSRIKR